MKNMQKHTNPLQASKYCYFCVNNVSEIDFKEVNLLRKFISSYMKIVPKKRSGACSAHQRQLAEAIKRSRFMGLLPYVPR